MNHFEIPATGELHIHRVVSEGDENLLSDIEKEKCSVFTSTSARQTYLKGHSAARFLTAHYTGKNPAQLEFAILPEGKPFFPCTPDLHFNLSHSGDFVFIAFSSDPVGFDIENLQRKADFQKLAARYFQSQERELMDRSEKEKNFAFLEIWTAKEAMIKLVGSGIALGLDKTLVLNEEEGIFNDTKIHLHRYKSGDFIGTLASFSRIQTVREFTY
jgi:phosphopantetheine--protein transferase-like protein